MPLYDIASFKTGYWCALAKAYAATPLGSRFRYWNPCPRMSAASQTADVFTGMNESADRLSRLRTICVDTANRGKQKLLSRLTNIIQQAQRENEHRRSASKDGPPPVELDKTTHAQIPESPLSSRDGTPGECVSSDRSSITPSSTASSTPPTSSTSSSHTSRARVTKRRPTNQQRRATCGNTSDDDSSDGDQSPLRGESSESR